MVTVGVKRFIRQTTDDVMKFLSDYTTNKPYACASLTELQVLVMCHMNCYCYLSKTNANTVSQAAR